MELVIFIGLQASGKSTYYRMQYSATHVHVSKDLLRNNGKSARRQLDLIEQALKEGRSVVVDNTNAIVADRAPLIALGQQYGAENVGCFFETPLGESLQRNQIRTGRERVPDVAIFATLKRLQRPSYQEGFDRLYGVLIVGDQTFELTVWDHDAAPEPS